MHLQFTSTSTRRLGEVVCITPFPLFQPRAFKNTRFTLQCPQAILTILSLNGPEACLLNPYSKYSTSCSVQVYKFHLGPQLCCSTIPRPNANLALPIQEPAIHPTSRHLTDYEPPAYPVCYQHPFPPAPQPLASTLSTYSPLPSAISNSGPTFQPIRPPSDPQPIPQHPSSLSSSAERLAPATRPPLRQCTSPPLQVHLCTVGQPRRQWTQLS